MYFSQLCFKASGSNVALDRFFFTAIPSSIDCGYKGAVILPFGPEGFLDIVVKEAGHGLSLTTVTGALKGESQY